MNVMKNEWTVKPCRQEKHCIKLDNDDKFSHGSFVNIKQGENTVQNNETTQTERKIWPCNQLL